MKSLFSTAAARRKFQTVGSDGPAESHKLARHRRPHRRVGMGWFRINLDDAGNESVIGRDGRISAAQSKLAVFVIHTDEETVIARETARIIEDR